MATSEKTIEERAASNVEEARKELAAGEIGKAFAALDRALTESHDRERLQEVYELALKAYAKAGFTQRYVTGGHAIVTAARKRLAQEARG